METIDRFFQFSDDKWAFNLTLKYSHGKTVYEGDIILNIKKAKKTVSKLTLYLMGKILLVNLLR